METPKKPKRKNPLNRPRGRPALDSKRSPHDLSEREWQFCQYRAMGYSPEESGKKLEIPAGPQQCEKWEENKAVQRSVALIRRSNPLIHMEIYRSIMADRVKELEYLSTLKEHTYRAMNSWMKDGKCSWENRLKILDFLTKREEHLLQSHRRNREIDIDTNPERKEFEALLVKLKAEFPAEKKVITLNGKRKQEAEEIEYTDL